MTRRLPDDALVVFLSDTHIGGAPGRDIFESPDDLAALFDDVAGHPGPVELVLAGDFFDFLRVGPVPAGETRASVTLRRPEYAGMFAALRRLAAGDGRAVCYLPGNHDAELWWNAEIRDALRREGLVHEVALAYAAAFASAPDDVVYCEHGNQFDPANTFHDFADPLDTPLGDHVVTDLIPHLGPRLRGVDRVFPMDWIPEWLISRGFYAAVTQTVRRLLLPLAVAFALSEAAVYALGSRSAGVTRLFVEIGYDLLLLATVFAVFLVLIRREAWRAIRQVTAGAADRHGAAGAADDAAGQGVRHVRDRLERGEPPPLGASVGGVAVFVSGHTHVPSLTEFARPAGGRGALVNSGCWLRRVEPVRAHLRLPAVFVSRDVQSHVRVRREADAIRVELWEWPRATRQTLCAAERVAIAGRWPAGLGDASAPHVRARVSVAAGGAGARRDVS